MAFTFLKRETIDSRTQETFTGNKCEIYIPESFFNKGDKGAFATELGTRIESVGLFWFKVNGTEWYEMQLPIKIQFEFDSYYKVHTKIKPEMPDDDYIVYTLVNGQAFIYDVLHKKDVDDLRITFVNKLIENGKLPATLSYKDSFNVFMNAITASGDWGIGVSAVSLEILLSELYRDKKNLNKAFRKVYNGKNEYGFKMIRIIKLPEINSTFTSLIGEDINNQLVASILRSRENKEEKISPIEKIIKY